MPIIFKSGNMFDEPVDAIVNTVNCVGVMGKGVALEFKRRWPANFREYRNLCAKKTLTIGKLFIHENTSFLHQGEPKLLVNFPTKQHWRSKSKIEYIESGLDALAKSILEYNIKSIAIPPLGCGNGGLPWPKVKVLIEQKLGHLQNINIIIFAPKKFLDQPEHTVSSFEMTFERAILLKAFGDLEKYFHGSYDRISMQKIVYFLQALGVDFRLSFSRNLYGPYSEPLRKAFVVFDKHELISGFRSDQRAAHVTLGAYALAEDYLTKNNNWERSQEIIQRLDNLIQGYESPFGLELLSSVHLLAAGENIRPVENVIHALRNWNEGKRSKFDDDGIRLAYERLSTDKLLQ